MQVSLDHLKAFVEDFIASIPKIPGEKAYLVGLEGELGAGKTAFVQKVGEILGIKDSITSPTFVLLKTYSIHHPVFEKMVHIDAYRLHPEDKDTIHLREYAEDPKNLIFIEWPERIHLETKQNRALQFKVLGGHEREITEHVV